LIARWQQLQPVPAPVALMTERRQPAVPSIKAQRISDSAIPRQRQTMRSVAMMSAVAITAKPGREVEEFLRTESCSLRRVAGVVRLSLNIVAIILPGRACFPVPPAKWGTQKGFWQWIHVYYGRPAPFLGEQGQDEDGPARRGATLRGGRVTSVVTMEFEMEFEAVRAASRHPRLRFSKFAPPRSPNLADVKAI
jgi:hypothetical protein